MRCVASDILFVYSEVVQLHSQSLGEDGEPCPDGEMDFDVADSLKGALGAVATTSNTSNVVAPLLDQLKGGGL